jgi:zinc protease
MTLVCRSGGAYDPKDLGGTASMMADLLTRGTSMMSCDSVKSTVEFLGGQFSGSAADDYCSVDLKVLSRDLGIALDLLADAVLHSAFDSQQVELTRGRMLAGARRLFDIPFGRVAIEFTKFSRGDHPYGHMTGGDTASLPRIRREDLIAFHQRYFRPNNCFLIAAGDVNHNDLVSDIERRLGEWMPAPVPTLSAAPMATPDRIRVKVITKSDMNQTYVEFGHPGICASDTDMLPVRLMSYILGGTAMSSRLGVDVRVKGGLAYDVRCSFERERLQGMFDATVQTAKPKEAISLMLRDIKTMHDSGATKRELEDAQNYYTGSFPLSYASMDGKLSQVRTMELYSYGMDWLAARQRLDPGKYWMVVIGPVTKDDLGLTDVEWAE